MQNLRLGGRKAEIRTRDSLITTNGYYLLNRVVLPYEWNIALFCVHSLCFSNTRHSDFSYMRHWRTSHGVITDYFWREGNVPV